MCSFGRKTLPTAATTTASQATTAAATVGSRTATAATAGATGLEGIFAQMIAAMEAAAAQAASKIGLTTTTTETGATTETKTDDTKTSDEASANTDLAGALAVMVQGGTLGASAGNLSSPASLGARAITASATSAAKAGIDAGPVTATASTPAGNSTATAGVAPVDPAIVDTKATATQVATPSPTATASTTAASATIAAATAATGTSGSSSASTDAGATKGATKDDGETTKTDALGIEAFVAKTTAATTEKAASGTLLYGRPTPRAGETASHPADDKTVAKTDAAAPAPSRLALDPTMNDPVKQPLQAVAQDAKAATAADLPANDHHAAARDDTSNASSGDPNAQPVGAPAQHQGFERIVEHATTTATTTAHAVTLSAVADTVASHVRAGTSHFAIKLDPAELGSIDVRVEVKSSGEVRAHLIVERSDTLDMMLRDQKTLERSLAQSGLDVGSSGLQFSLKDQGSGGGSNTRDDLPRTWSAEAEETSPVTPDLAATAYRPRRVGGLDLRI